MACDKLLELCTKSKLTVEFVHYVFELMGKKKKRCCFELLKMRRV